MPSIEKLLTQIENNTKDVRFTDLCKICEHFFDEPRQSGTSHKVYKTPWAGDPRVNIQNSKGKTKDYQVKQVLKAINKLKDEKDEQ